LSGNKNAPDAGGGVRLERWHYVVCNDGIAGSIEGYDAINVVDLKDLTGQGEMF
jgi:hypothetical protein